MEKPDDLETRVNQFQAMQLPGQPMMMHMGTAYMVNDLWTEIKKLRAELQTLRSLYDGKCKAYGEASDIVEKQDEEIDRLRAELQTYRDKVG